MSTTAKTNQYRLELVSLKCIRKQDTFGNDDPELWVNGVKSFGPGSLGKGDTVDLRPRTAMFTNVANINLIEADAGNDDDLGTVTATASQANKGEQTGEYSLPGSDYKLVYKVVRV